MRSNLTVDDLTRFKFLSGIRYSPDAGHACFIVHEMDAVRNDYRSCLYLYDANDGSIKRLTSSCNEKSFLWMRDSENILFQNVRDEKDTERLANGEDFAEFYRIDIHGGEAVKCFEVPVNVNDILQVGDDTYLLSSAFNGNRPLQYRLTPDEKSKELDSLKREKDYEVLEEIPFWSNGEGFVSRKRNRLYIYHPAKNTVEPITSETFNTEDFNLRADGKKAVIVGSDYSGRMPLTNSVYLYDTAAGTLKRLDHGGLSFSFADFISDEMIICTATDMKKFGINENPKFYTIDLKTNRIECISPALDFSLGNSVGSDCRYGSSLQLKADGGKLYYISTERYASYINSIDRNGNRARITELGGSADGFDVKRGHVLFIGGRKMKLQELYRLDGDEEKQITDFNGWVQSERNVMPLEKLCFKNEKGSIIDGWVIKPVGFDKSKEYPAILDVHGGPKTVYGEVFFHEMQYWAGRGYFVFFCNPTGSDGGGNEFADIRGKYGMIDYRDLMSFTDLVLQSYPQIDASKVAVTGGSYGGFMTNWIIGHTDRFAAAASQRSISNWISKFGTTDIGYYFADDQNGGTPWNNFNGLWEHSPLKYADRVKTPTLFIHSDADYRCYIAEGLQMFTALKYHGIDARLCMFHGENHELSRSGKPLHRIRRLSEITGWFDRYLK